MQYALLFYQTPEVFAARDNPKVREAFWASFVPYMKAMEDAGIVVAGAGLQKPGAAASVRPDGASRLVQDGPYADSKEQLAGFFIIEVRDMDEAMQWASRYPAGPGCGVEVRPCMPRSDRGAMLESATAGKA